MIIIIIFKFNWNTILQPILNKSYIPKKKKGRTKDSYIKSLWYQDHDYIKDTIYRNIYFLNYFILEFSFIFLSFFLFYFYIEIFLFCFYFFGILYSFVCTVSPRYNKPYVSANQAFIISNFVNAITNYSV
jgi:hypothetical protein